MEHSTEEKTYSRNRKGRRTVRIEKLKDAQLPGFISSYLKRKQVEIEPKAAEMMAEFVGTDLNRMAGELEN